MKAKDWCRWVFGISMVLLPWLGTAQQDTLQGQSTEEVVITATRTERKLSNVAVPTTLISNQQIQATQLRRLHEILSEQTGIFVTNGSGAGSFGGGIFGNGAQLQGMSPEYTLILINGEPIIGRQGGTVNLSRLALHQIKKIEIVKGPSSSLYGSEAMGGVINIITELPVNNTAEAALKAGGYGMLDATASGTLAGTKGRAMLAYNHYRHGAIDFDKGSFGNQQDPFNTNTLQGQWQQQLGTSTKLLTYARWYNEQSKNAYEVPDANLNTIRIAGHTQVKDANLNTTLVHKISTQAQTALRLYATHYQSSQQLNTQKDNQPYYADDFRQQFYRIENQTDLKLPANNQLSAGGGFVYERLNTTRYAGIRTNSIAYAFLQNEWQPNTHWNIIGGLRYDANQQYASRLSPKLALRYSPHQKLKLTASYGAGFKAPDFRQLYLSFINNASGGYALFGANEISLPRLQAMQQQGLIQTILPRANDLQQLKPEISQGLNAGASYTISSKWQAEANIFYNDIRNQILFDVVALRPNGSQVFSYFNIARSLTTGAELNLRWQAAQSLSIQGGYQWLYTADKQVLADIKAGQVFGRNATTNAVYRLSAADYAGLPNRSRHMANLRLFYQPPAQRWSASLRAAFRSRWGTFDRDGNGIINRKDETAPGFVMMNATGS
ncbi:MAG TPA: TonB-dependent receptor, partial [Phnomibacter sp.]|nr:TonB-dependent receptor [Phnomibacter sp.]